MATVLEISCPSAADALLAESAGATRIELCSDLFTGGLTPSPLDVQQASARLHIPLVVMIRPRAGDFCYSASEFETMQRDTVSTIQAGVAGVVLGILRSDRTIDVARCNLLQQLAVDKEVVFHRAFDVIPDPARGLEELIDLGFTRVLTSGQRATALEGSELIARLIKQAKGRIEILPGGKIRPDNVREILRRTGCTQVHLAPLTTHGQSERTDKTVVEQVASELRLHQHHGG